MSGTPMYMAPELSAGERVVPSADVFSLGILAYEVLTTKTPWHDPPSLAINQGRPVTTPAPIDQLVPSLPPETARVLDRCLSLDPAHRPTPLEVVAALRAALGQP
ncbi:MAG: protein kinase [Kofleriaceae bacterium]